MAICGVDVSKDWLDVWLAPVDRFARHANSPEGVAALASDCFDAGIELVVMEASGGYEQAAYRALWRHGLACATTNARAVRDFAKAMGYLEKTDRIDARMIAEHAAAKRIVPSPAPSEEQRKINNLAARLRQIISDITIQKQRLASARDATARSDLGEIIALLLRQRKAATEAIAAMIETDPLWQALGFPYHFPPK